MPKITSAYVNILNNFKISFLVKHFPLYFATDFEVLKN